MFELWRWYGNNAQKQIDIKGEGSGFWSCGKRGEWAYWGQRLAEIWKLSTAGIAAVNSLISDLDLTGLISAASYLRNARDEFFTASKLKEEEVAPEPVMVATDPVEREFREINRRTEVGARWSRWRCGESYQAS
jgi:hypothetical protein